MPELEAKKAFERFETWLKEREINPGHARDFMFMHNDGKYYQFKNINTRNYIFVNIIPTAFNL